MMNNRIYKLHSNCRIISGFKRSLIADLQRNNFHFIPNDIVKIINNNTIYCGKIVNELDEESLDVFDEYIELLLNLELIFECSESLLENFIDFPMEWDFPAIISNAIFDTEQFLYYFDESLVSQLEQIFCNYCQIRFYSKSNIEEYERVVNLINLSQIKSVDIIISDDTSNDSFTKWATIFIEQNTKIRCLTLHSSNSNCIVKNQYDNTGTIIKVKEVLTSEKHCGNIHSSYFIINVENFTESQSFNSCLNRKIAIDINGNIKNCPSMAKSFGNIKETKLIEVATNPEFQKVWGIKKDEITKCKDCEFRYICTDCRAYIDNPSDVYSAPLKCGYNPYTCEWEDWSTSPLKQQTKRFYNL